MQSLLCNRCGAVFAEHFRGFGGGLLAEQVCERQGKISKKPSSVQQPLYVYVCVSVYVENMTHLEAFSSTVTRGVAAVSLHEL